MMVAGGMLPFGCASRGGSSGADAGTPRTHLTGAEVAVSGPVQVDRADAVLERETVQSVETMMEDAVPAWQEIGRSREDRAIRAATFGNGPRRVYLIAGIHGTEQEGLQNIDLIRRELLSGEIAGRTTVRLVEDMNPDGSEAGTRHNTAGIDLNRNWPAKNFKPAKDRGPEPLSEPETRAVHDDLLAFDPHIVVVLHSTAEGPFVNFDGPGLGFADAFNAAAKASDERWRVVADMGYPTPGSLGTFVGIDRGVPILTIEFERGQDAVSAWAALAPALRAVAAHEDRGGPTRLADEPRPADRPRTLGN